MMVEGFEWYGLFAWILITFGVISSTLGFKGMRDEEFSYFNHFISELGDPRFAKHFKLFALSLILGGVLLIPFIIGFGNYFDSLLAKICVGVGISTAVASCLVGIFNEEKVWIHFTVAGCFFFGAVLLVILVSILILKDEQSLLPPWLNIFSILVVIFFIAFIGDTARLDKEELDRTNEPWNWEIERPKFWLNPFLEWCAFFSILLWLILIVSYSFHM